MEPLGNPKREDFDVSGFSARLLGFGARNVSRLLSDAISVSGQVRV